MSSQNARVWKAEPVSPSGTSIADAEDDWNYFDDKSSTLINDVIHCEWYNDKNSTRAEVATKLLEELDEWIKEEPLSDWLEEKVESLFDELPSPECGQNKPIILPNVNVKPSPPTELLLQEFETVLGGVEACHQIYPSESSALTPPQSPPGTGELPLDTELLVTLQPLGQNIDFVYPQNNVIEVDPLTVKSDSYFSQISGEWNAENVSLSPLSGDVASELAAVDEYVRSCAEDISPSSPVTSSGSSSISSEDAEDDPDWTIDSSSTSSSSSSKQRSSKSSKNRYKPYARPNVEDKKVRKKEQNKNAATRYRQKKKMEIKEIVGEEQELLDHNDKLQDQVKELSREIGYLKGLMRDLFRAKGLMK